MTRLTMLKIHQCLCTVGIHQFGAWGAPKSRDVITWYNGMMCEQRSSKLTMFQLRMCANCKVLAERMVKS